MCSAPLAAFVTVAALALQGCSKPPATATADLKTGTFGTYFGYTGALTVGGTVTVKTAGKDANETQSVVSATLTGVDTACTGTQSGDGNKCGFHIHKGTDCSVGTEGHFFKGDTDPWVPVTYTDAATGNTTAADTTVDTGYTLAELLGHVMVVHDSDGARVACAKLEIDDDALAAAESVSGSVSARSGTDQGAPGAYALVFVAGMVVMAVLGGGAWFCQSSRRGYAAQEDAAVEVQSVAPKQEDTMEGQSAA